MPAEALHDSDLATLADPSPPPAQRQGDAGLLIRFFHKPFRELREVEVEGGVKEARHVWVKREMVELRVPGDKTNAPVKFVTDEHRRRWAAQYAAWKAGEEQETAGGMPLEKWPGVDVAQVEELRGARVRTVEQLAGLSDANLSKLGPGWRPVRQAAQDWLQASKSAAPLAALREQNDALRAQVDAQAAQMQEMANAIAELKKQRKEKAA